MLRRHASLRRAGMDRASFMVLTVLILLLAAGGLVRLHGIEQRAFRQGEIYVPGIPLPAYVSNPSERLTLLSTVTGSLKDIHPPTWYMGMWLWTKLFGTGLVAIRLPSLFFGTLIILLTYWVATLETDRLSALLAATFV